MKEVFTILSPIVMTISDETVKCPTLDAKLLLVTRQWKVTVTSIVMASAVNVDFWNGNKLSIRVKSSCCPGVINHSLQVFWIENFNTTNTKTCPACALARRGAGKDTQERLADSCKKTSSWMPTEPTNFRSTNHFTSLIFGKFSVWLKERGKESCWIMIIIIRSNWLLQMRSYCDCVSVAFLPSSWSPSTTHPRTLVLLRLYGPFSSWAPSSSSPPSPQFHLRLFKPTTLSEPAISFSSSFPTSPRFPPSHTFSCTTLGNRDQSESWRFLLHKGDLYAKTSSGCLDLQLERVGKGTFKRRNIYQVTFTDCTSCYSEPETKYLSLVSGQN